MVQSTDVRRMMSSGFDADEDPAPFAGTGEDVGVYALAFDQKVLRQ